jgi:uncharacterized membrane protein (DUF485 family)
MAIGHIARCGMDAAAKAGIGLDSRARSAVGENAMDADLLARIQANPKYQLLKKRRTRFGWSMTVVMLIAYYGYVGLIAFDKPFLGRPIGAGVTSLGIPVGVGLIVFTIVLTGIYVLRANGEYDRLTAEILAEAKA